MESSDISRAEFYRCLKATSRAFYLSLRFLPGSTRLPIALAYALARTADSLADQFDLPVDRRRELLDSFEVALEDPSTARSLAVEGAHGLSDSGERALLAILPANRVLLAELGTGDRTRIREVLGIIVEGMRLDLDTFAGGLAALPSRAELDRYTYCVAGCVGEFWSRTAAAHLPGWARRTDEQMEGLGIRFGRGLQLTNILRDLPRDLAGGRCYLPAPDLSELGLAPADLLDPSAIGRVRPLVDALLAEAVSHYEAGFAYTLALARWPIALRVSCALPLLIGIETLGSLAVAEDLLDPDIVHKVPRRRVRQLVVQTLVRAGSDRGLAGLFGRTMRGAGFSPKGDREGRFSPGPPLAGGAS